MAHRCTLTKRAAGHISGERPLDTGTVNRFEVFGLPPRQQAFIDLNDRRRWQVMRIGDDQSGDYTGDYSDDDEALAALQREIDDGR